MFSKCIYGSAEYETGVRVGWHDEFVVHPLTLPSGCHDACPSKVCQMPRNLRLWDADNFDEVTDTYFLPSYQVDEPKTGGISQRTEKSFKWEPLFHARSLA
jgi:hypothetical protein